MMRAAGLAFVLALALSGVMPRITVADTELALEDALREARRANASLPVSHLDARAAAAAVDEANAGRFGSIAFDGDVHTGFPARYASSDARAQLVASMPLYDGGRLRAGVASSGAAADGARAGYHKAERDLDLAVRTLFATCLEAEQEIAFRQAGIERLRGYGSAIEARRAGGQGVAADLSKTGVRLGEAEANVADAERRRDDAKLELNELMGRPPGAVLELAPLPPPGVSEIALASEPWLQAPEIAQAGAAQRVAAAHVDAVHAERLPEVSLMVDGGAQPVWGNSKLALLNNGEGWGGELVLSVNVPLWDAGVHRSRVAQAELGEAAARQHFAATQSGVRLAWQRAVTGLGNLQREVGARTRTVEKARDSYLQAESLYRGGAGTALDVLDAYDAWVGANQLQAEAVLRARVTEAELIRWGTP